MDNVKKVEQAKIRLSNEQNAYVEILGALKDSAGDNIDVDKGYRHEKPGVVLRKAEVITVLNHNS